jgi:hypothetical protein
VSRGTRKDAVHPRIDVASCSVHELLAGYGAILDELRARDIVRSANSPVSDYADCCFAMPSDGRARTTPQPVTMPKTGAA